MKAKLFTVTALTTAMATVLAAMLIAGGAQAQTYSSAPTAGTGTTINSNAPASPGNTNTVAPTGDTNTTASVQTTTDATNKTLANTTVGKWDLNGDGMVSRMEWKASMPVTFGLKRRKIRTFDTWDMNKDGFIDTAEAEKIPQR